jgi:hypothetical protein
MEPTDLAVAEPEHAKALGRWPRVSARVVVRIVKRPVGLDDQPMPETHEIDHVGPNRHLPPKFQVGMSPVAKQLPEELLDGGSRTP